MNGDHRLQPGCRVNAQVQRFKAGALHESEHRKAPESLPVVASIGVRLKIAEAHRNKQRPPPTLCDISSTALLAALDERLRQG
jgi:hypothetical protein